MTSEAWRLHLALIDWRFAVDARYGLPAPAYVRMTLRHQRHLLGLAGYMSRTLRENRAAVRRFRIEASRRTAPKWRTEV